jgi:hypothetical protein
VDARATVVAQSAARRAQPACGIETISTRDGHGGDEDGDEDGAEDSDEDAIDRAFLDDGARPSPIIVAARARSSGWGRCPYGGSIIAPRLRFWRRFG